MCIKKIEEEKWEEVKTPKNIKCKICGGRMISSWKKGEEVRVIVRCKKIDCIGSLIFLGEI